MKKATFITTLTFSFCLMMGSAMAQSETTSATYTEKLQSQIELTTEQIVKIDAAYAEVLNGLSPEKVADLETKMLAKIKVILSNEQYNNLQEVASEREKTNKMSLDKARRNTVESLPVVEKATAFEEE
jgi:phosphomevalonate kinase